ncbi:MAG TPA: GNAT family N-acetyltransferase, partial [Bacteroidia bacterium]|nr:GNAT family N-acetyltransferase [Bacteroidia bacterium]
MNSMVEFTSSPTELEAVINLRYRVLRAPWNQSLETARDELEHLSFNAFIRSAGGQVIACGRLQLNSPDTGQIRYMAVENQEQGKGYGAAILRALELKAQSLGLRKIELQA